MSSTLIIGAHENKLGMLTFCTIKYTFLQGYIKVLCFYVMVSA